MLHQQCLSRRGLHKRMRPAVCYIVSSFPWFTYNFFLSSFWSSFAARHAIVTHDTVPPRCARRLLLGTGEKRCSVTLPSPGCTRGRSNPGRAGTSAEPASSNPRWWRRGYLPTLPRCVASSRSRHCKTTPRCMSSCW